MLLQFSCGPIATNTYLISCDDTKEAMIIDAPFNSTSILLESLKQYGLDLKLVILTHSHWDHLGDIHQLRKSIPFKLGVHKNDVQNLLNPGSDGIPLMQETIGEQPDFFLSEDKLITIGNLEFEVIHTPGHSPGGVCLYSKQKKILFSGDTLFKNTIGLIDIPTGDSDSMWNSLKKLAKLPKDTSVYPGHGEMTTIGGEPWLAKAKSIFG